MPPRGFNSKKSGLSGNVTTSDIDSSGALDIDAGTGDVTIDSASGSLTLGAALANGQTLKLGPNAATEMIFTPHGTAGSEKISLTNTAGDAADAIKLLSTAGGVTIDAGGGTVTFADNGASLGTITSSGYSGTATTVTVTDSDANTDFPVVFHNESNGLLDDTAAFEYNPNKGKLVVSAIYKNDLRVGEALTEMHLSFATSGQVKIYSGAEASNTLEFLFDNAGNFHADNDITSFSASTGSDKRLKTNIKNINYGLEDILKLRGVEFDWKEKRNGKHDIGFIAQEVREVIPEVINEIPNIEDETDNYLGVDYSKIVPILVEAIKEQQKQIDELKGKIN